MKRFTVILSKLTDINSRTGFVIQTLAFLGVFVLMYVSFTSGLLDGAGGFTYAEY